MNNGWTTLGNLKPGTLFETERGGLYVKMEDLGPDDDWPECLDLNTCRLTWLIHTDASVRELDLVGRSMDPPDAGESQDPFGIGFNAGHRQGWTDCQERLRRKP